MWPNVPKVVDGVTQISADGLNPIVDALTHRTHIIHQRQYQDINAALVCTGVPTTAVAGDFVALVDSQAQPALASVDLLDASLLSPQSVVVGVVSVVDQGLADIVVSGRYALASGSAPIPAEDLMQPGETPRPGPYWLSSTAPGKLTAEPRGPRIFVGTLAYRDSEPEFYVQPQPRQHQAEHRHRGFELVNQAIGETQVSGGTVAILGIESITTPVEAYLVPRGSWSYQGESSYDIWVSRSDSVAEAYADSLAPLDWGQAWLHAVSTDPLETATVSRLTGYNHWAGIGSKGVEIQLNPVGDRDTTPDTARRWSLGLPEDGLGWRQYLVDQELSGPQDYRLKLYGSPDLQQQLDITCVSGELWSLTFGSNPVDGNTVTSGTLVFEFDNNDAVTPGNISVAIGDTAIDSCANLVAAMRSAGLNAGKHTSDAYAVALGALVSTGPSVAKLSDGVGDLESQEPAVMITSGDDVLLADTASSVWLDVGLYTRQDLITSGFIEVVPYAADGTTAADLNMYSGDTWTTSVSVEIPGTRFVYNAGFNQDLYRNLEPASGSQLVISGLQQPGYPVVSSGYTWGTGLTGIHWCLDAEDSEPWTGLAVYTNTMMSVGSTGIVTSVRGIPGGPVSVYARGTTTPADSGPLDIGFDFNALPGQQQVGGYTVVKSMQGHRINTGPVVERLSCPDGSLSITQRLGHPSGQGDVFISSQSNGFGGELEYLSYGNAKFERQGMFQYTKLLGWDSDLISGNINTGFYARFIVPHGLDPALDFKALLYFTVFGTQDIAAGQGISYAGLVFEYSVLPDYVGVNQDPAWNSIADTAGPSNPLGLLNSDPIAVELPLGTTSGDPVYRAYDPVMLHNDSDLADQDRRQYLGLGPAVPDSTTLSYWDSNWGQPRLKPGSVVAIKVSRGPISSGQEYKYPLGFLNLRWKLVTV
jgi:hypothetical protein